jgi:hypothetical protein
MNIYIYSIHYKRVLAPHIQESVNIYVCRVWAIEIYKYIDKAPCNICYIYYIVVGIGLANSSRFSWEKRNIIILSMCIYVYILYARR